jgi:filamentous hemagglutinin
MLGANGTQVSSKTTWKNGKTPGQIHYHDAHNNKYYYDTDDKLFYNQKTGEFAPKEVQKLLKGNSFANGIKKALKVLGEQYE